MSTTTTKPSHVLRAIGRGARLYSKIFASGPAAPLLSRERPVRRTGFDLSLVVAAVTAEADDVVSLTLVRPEGGALPSWVPGAHLDVFLESGLQRQYSLNGDPADRSHYRIAVRRIGDGGGGSIAMHDLVAGDRLEVRGPRNAFTFAEAPSYLFIAGGIGITPILPMVRAAAARGVSWKLIYAGRTIDSLPFLDELTALADPATDQLHLHADDVSGIPDVGELLRRGEPGAAVYVCGPPPMIDAARALLPELNPTASIHSERFSAPPVVGGRPFTVELARTGQTVEVGADESALAAIRREMPGVRYSCQQGFCGSCKVSVLRGAVEHRDTKLAPVEREDHMLICVSRAGDDSIAIDL